MHNRFSLRHLPFVLAMMIAVIGITEGALSPSVFARTLPNEGSVLHGNSGSAKQTLQIVKKRRSSKKSSKKKSRKHTSRRYTVRGNPEVTRRVATQVIVERLPELASLIGLEAPTQPVAESGAETTPQDASVTAERASIPETVPTKTVDVPTAGASSISAAKGNGIILTSFSPTTGSPAAVTNRVAAHTTGTPAQSLSTTNVTTNISSTTSTATSRTSASNYDDSELSAEEDPDKLTVEDEEMLAAEDDLTIDEFYDEFTNYMASLNGESDTYVTDNGIDKTLAMETLVDWLGTRYLFGGTSRNGIDCSAFTRTMYGSLGCPLPRTAASQWDAGDEIELDNLQFGDLVFFHTREAVYVSHVGIYLGNNMFAHASSRNGVTVSSLETNYYSTHLIGARRFDVAGAKAEREMEAVAARAQEADTTEVQ